MGKTILDYETAELLDDVNKIRIIDQTQLPGRIECIELETAKQFWDAIYLLQVRGAPAIGVFAGFAIYLLTKETGLPKEDTRENRAENFAALRAAFEKNKDYLNSSRPTAVNLSWALCRMEKVFLSCGENDRLTMREIVERLHEECVAIRNEDVEVCRRIGENGLALVKPGDGLLTHCNAGQLATIRYGTATAPMYLGHERGYNFHIYCDETRPLLQGARLTSYELQKAGVDVTLICDNMASIVMKQGKINAVFVGCDRIAANGDFANKIGTSGVAILAKHYGVPFYTLGPSSTIDFDTPTGDDIHIELRDPEEVKEMWYKEPMALKEVKSYNPSFDVTDHTLVTGIVTERGIVYPPFKENLKKLFNR